jgi:hypothetical protein
MTERFAQWVDGTEGKETFLCSYLFHTLQQFPSSIRLYSTKSFKPLGTLKYHKANCQCLAFAHAAVNEGTTEEGDDDESDDELTASDKAARSQWLLAGSKDNRVSIWTLISFESASSHS